MSQIRGRIKTVVDYDERITNEGTCCESDGTKSVKTLSRCSQGGGRWVPALPPESVTCPQLSENGCCCSCAYTTKNTGTSEDWAHPNHAEDILAGKYSSRNGTRNNVSRCECDYNNGNFLVGDCPEPGLSIASLCETDGVEGRNDVRWPFSCCHCDTDADGYLFRNCSNVCNRGECLEFSEAYSSNPDCASEFDPFRICDYETYFGGSSKECADILIEGCTDPAASNYNPNANSDDGSCEYGPPQNPFAPLTLPDPDDNYTDLDTGSCCIYDEQENKFRCEYKGRGSCEQQNGFFSVDKEGNSKNCRYVSCPKAPVMNGDFANPPSIKESDLPEIGDLFAGGIYLGVFSPKTSLTRSKLETGRSVRATTVSSIGVGRKFKRWALIAAPADIGREMGGDTPFQIGFQTNSEEVQDFISSTFDGHYNTFGNGKNVVIPKSDLFNKVRRYYLFNFKDWYVPSIQELGFAIHQQKDIDVGTFKRRISESRSKLKISQPYLSSTTKIREKTNETEKYPTANLVYQILTEDNINSRVFTTLASRTAPANVRLFRRIYIEE